MSNVEKIYGPFYRINSPTQTDEIAALQIQNKEIWGQPIRNNSQSDIPRVKAYSLWVGGPNERGIMFTTRVPPDENVPPTKVFWSGPRKGVVVENGYAKIKVEQIDNYP